MPISVLSVMLSVSKPEAHGPHIVLCLVVGVLQGGNSHLSCPYDKGSPSSPTVFCYGFLEGCLCIF